MYPAEMKKHLQKCMHVCTDRIREQLETEFEERQRKMSAHHDREIAETKSFFEQQLSAVRAENKVLQAELSKAQRLIQTLSEQAINRPTSVTHQQNISTVKITNHLADHKAYLSQTHPSRVRDMLDQHLENYFLDGQQGLARFVVEHIIRMEDGKMILCCTDPSRKRFRFVDADARLAEDMRAKMLCSKLKMPIREMCNEVFDRIMNRLRTEKKVMISSGAGAFDIDFLDKKLDYAEKKFIEIRSFDSEDNADFLNELASLLRNPSLMNGLEEDDQDGDKYENVDVHES